MNNVIEFKKVKKLYNEKIVIENLNLSIEQGEFITVIGSSGCGKTTLLKMINGLSMATSGDVVVNGENLNNRNLIDLRRNIGYVIQGSVLFPHMTVEKNISYVLDLVNKKDKDKNKKRVCELLKLVCLDEDLLSRYPDELSGGQQQRVGIARALAASPEIVLMDEPFGAVDEITRKNLQNEIKNIHKKTGVTIVFVTHDISEALTLGTKVLVMNKGAVEQFDTPQNILKNPATPFVKELISN